MRHLLLIGTLSALMTGGMTVESGAAQAEAYRERAPSASPTTQADAQREGAVAAADRGRSGRIQTREGVDLGELKDFLIEPQKGCIAYGIVSLTGSASEEPMVIFPWKLVQPDPTDPTASTFRLQVKRDVLHAAPRLSRDQWAHASVAAWMSAVESYWVKKTIQPCATSPTATATMIKASDLIDMNIRRESGEAVGIIRELIIDGEHGTIAFAVVAQDDPSIPSLRIFFTLPWNALYLDSSERAFVVRSGDKTAI